MRVLLPKKFITELNKITTFVELIKAIKIIFSTPTYYNNDDIYKALVSKIKSLDIQNGHYCSYGVIHAVFDYLFKPDRDNPDKAFDLFELLVGLSAENNYTSNQFVILPNNTKDKNTQINLCIYIYFDLDEMLTDEEFIISHQNTITLIQNNWYPFLVYICKYYDIMYTKTLASICRSINIIKTIRAIKNSSFSEFKKSIISYPSNNPEDNASLKKLFSKLSLLLQYNDEKKKFVKYVALTTHRNEKILTFIKDTVNDLSRDNTDITEEKIEMLLFTAIEYFSKINFSKIVNIESDIPFMYALRHYIMLCKSMSDSDINSLISSMIYQTITFIMDIDSQLLPNGFNVSLREVIHKTINELDFSSDDVFVVSESMINKHVITDPKIALEEYTKETSANVQHAQNRIYGAYKNFKRNEGKIESQADKALIGLKNMFLGNKRKEIIEGKEFSPMKLFKKLIGGLAIFSISPILAAIGLITKKALDKKTTMRERYKILQELETEVVLISEKIADARGAGDNKAKYILMRQKSELERAIKRIRYGLPADSGSNMTLKETMDEIKERNEG